jgi:hypothetical protein
MILKELLQTSQRLLSKIAKCLFWICGERLDRYMLGERNVDTTTKPCGQSGIMFAFSYKECVGKALVNYRSYPSWFDLRSINFVLKSSANDPK